MQIADFRKTALTAMVTATLVGSAASIAHASNDPASVKIDKTIIGTDNNSASNPFVQPQDPAFSGGGRDQSLQFGDTLLGSNRDDLMIGKLGADVLLGRRGDDVMIGGIEHFNPLNRDRALGGTGDDIFIWKPGDGSDEFRGGPGVDVVVFGITGELVDGKRKFEVLNDQQSADVALNRKTGLPKVDVTNSPGFCKVIDKSVSPDARRELRALDLNHLVQFFIRGVANDFESGVQSTDNGLRVTLHLNSVEVLVCTDRNGGVVEILDLTASPPRPITIADVQPRKLRNRLHRIVR